MILLSALFAALCLAAAFGSLHAGQPHLAALWAFGGGWWGNKVLRDVLGWLYDWRAERRGGR